MILLLLLVSMSVNVNVFNKSLGKGPLPLQTVYLYGFTKEGNLSMQDSALTDKKGDVTFNLKKGYVYIFQTNYKEIPYLTEAIDLSKDTTVEKVDLPVYETTVTEDSLSMGAGHIVLTQSDASIFITEMLALDNFALRTFIGGLYFILPPGSGQTFSPAEPNAQTYWSISGDTVFYVGPLYPGRKIIAFQYQLAGKGKITVTHTLPVKAKVFRILSSKEIKLISSSLEYGRDMQIDKNTYKLYEGSNVESVSFTVEKPGATRFSWPLFTVALLLALFVAIFIFRKKIIPPKEPNDE